MDEASSGSSEAEGEIRFGPFVLDDRRLLHHGRAVPLQPQPVRVLRELVRAGGEVVSREDLQRAVWGDRHVDAELGLNQCIRRIRNVLGDRADGPLYVETVRGRGYRFIAPIKTCAHSVPRFGIPVPIEAPAPSPRAPRRPTWIAAAVVAVAGTILAASALVGGRRSDPAPGRPPESSATGIALGAEPPHRLAVVPFADLGHDDETAYVGRGLRDEMVATLAMVDPRRLAVFALPSGAGALRGAKGDMGKSTAPAPAADVDLVLGGSVLQEARTLRVTLKLERRRDGRTLWARSSDHPASDLLAARTELAGAVTEVLVRELDLRPPPPETADVDPAAWQAFFEARYRRLAKDGEGGPSLEVLRRAARQYPEFARVWVELARTELAGELPWSSRNEAARTSLDRALALDPELGEAHLLRGDVAFFHDWDWPAAQRHYEAAVRLAPGRADAHKGYAFWLSSQRRHREAIARVERATRLDPVSVRLEADLGFFLMRAGRVSEAAEQCRRALALDPESTPAHVCLIETYALLGRDEAALEHIAAVMRGAGAAAADVEGVLSAGPATAVRRFFAWSLARYQRAAEQGRARPIALARTHAQLGQAERALDWLERAEEKRSFFMPFIGIDPAFRDLSGRARFATLLWRLDLLSHRES